MNRIVSHPGDSRTRERLRVQLSRNLLSGRGPEMLDSGLRRNDGPKIPYSFRYVSPITKLRFGSRIAICICVVVLFCGRLGWGDQGHLYAAAGKIDITPDLNHESVWLAGYGPMGRRAKGVHDKLYARALLVSDGIKTAALVSLDLIGIYREDVLDMRRSIGWENGDKYLFVAATHDHSGPDTLGLWGPVPSISGVDFKYHHRLKDSVVRLVKDLSEHMQPAELAALRENVDPKNLCRDSRDPVVIDPEMDIVQLKSKKGRQTIGTLVRWSCHAEALGSNNLFVTADYPGPLCDRVEEGEKGTCVFFNGVIGGLMTPEVDERSKGIDHQFEESKRMGRQLGDLVLKASKHLDRGLSGPVSFDSSLLKIPVENSRYLLFLRSLIFGHKLLDKDGNVLAHWKSWWLPLRHLILFPLPVEMRPWVETEISRIRLGPIEILGIPGEMFPELAIGGYDGRYRFAHELIQPGNVNPPDLSQAPKGPYLREKIKSKYGILIGLANDELGYFVPAYDFKITPGRMMSPRPPGHHYEETNSIGPAATGIILKGFDELLGRKN